MCTNLPVVEHGQAEGLSLRVRPQIRLKAKGVYGWDESLDGVQRRARNRCVLGHVTPEKILENHECASSGMWQWQK